MKSILVASSLFVAASSLLGCCHQVIKKPEGPANLTHPLAAGVAAKPAPTICQDSGDMVTLSGSEYGDKAPFGKIIRRTARKIQNLTLFNTGRCPIVASHPSYNKVCSNGEAPVFDSDKSPNLLTVSTTTAGPHLDAWDSDGTHIVDVDLKQNKSARGSDYISWLQGDDSGSGNTFFVYLDNVVAAGYLAKYYMVEVFYKGFCEDDRPDNSEGVLAPTCRPGAACQGNTTGGPEHQ
ncbi:MAG: hypothetical protein ABIO49_10965 [Dokdonella sp.]